MDPHSESCIRDTIFVSDGTPIALKTMYDNFLLCIEQPYIKGLYYGFGGGGIRFFYKVGTGTESRFFTYVNPALMTEPFEICIRYSEQAMKPDTIINFDVNKYETGYSYTYGMSEVIRKKF